MLPLGDINPRRTFPWLTYLLILANFIMFFVEMNADKAFIFNWAFIPERFLNNPLGETSTLFSSIFMHAGWLHILGNMLYLWIFGDNVEDRLGHFRFLLFYFICGLAATFAHLVFNIESGIPVLGASGAIAGVLGAYIVMFPRSSVAVLMGLFIIPLPAILVIGFWVVIQIFYGVGSIGYADQVGVAYMAHIGGFVTGLLLAIIYRIFGRIRTSRR